MARGVEHAKPLPAQRLRSSRLTGNDPKGCGFEPVAGVGLVVETLEFGLLDSGEGFETATQSKVTRRLPTW